MNSDVNIPTLARAVVPAGQAVTVVPLRIGRDGVAALWSDWERFSFAHSGASVSEFLNTSGARSI